MNQTYVYRKHLRAPLHYLMLMELIIFLGVIIMTFGLLITDNEKVDGLKLIIYGIVSLVAFVIVSLELVLMYFLLLKRFKSINITLTEDAIEYTNSKGQTIIPYEDIEKLEFPSIKYTGGWMKIIYRGGNVRLTVVLENIGGFVSELKEKIIQRKMEHVYNEKKLFSFFKTAVFADESWDRAYHIYKMQIVIHYLSLIFTIILLLVYHKSSNQFLFILGSLVAPLLGYLISEIIIGIKVKKRVEREELRLLPRNPQQEQKIFTIFFMGFSIGYLLILLVALM